MTRALQPAEDEQQERHRQTEQTEIVSTARATKNSADAVATHIVVGCADGVEVFGGTGTRHRDGNAKVPCVFPQSSNAHRCNTNAVRKTTGGEGEQRQKP